LLPFHFSFVSESDLEHWIEARRLFVEADANPQKAFAAEKEEKIQNAIRYQAYEL
jgi:hypothetical protein